MDYFTKVLLDLPLSQEFSRIKKGEELSSSNIPYTILYIDLMIKYFELTEKYENCEILLNFKNLKIKSHDSKWKVNHLVEHAYPLNNHL